MLKQSLQGLYHHKKTTFDKCLTLYGSVRTEVIVYLHIQLHNNTYNT